MVKGVDAEESKAAQVASHQTPDNSPAPSVASDSDHSLARASVHEQELTNGDAAPTKRNAPKARETMQAMVRRISEFMKVLLSEYFILISVTSDDLYSAWNSAHKRHDKKNTGVFFY